MQDFQSITGLSGRIFGGVTDGTGGLDNRSLRAYPSATMAGAPHPPPPVKCPRCESLNTKFCYYNNYNLSQPRHFCKSCRRYWTKGGVLRNVPVGGGCRKHKRSSSKSSSKSSSNDKDHRRPSGSRSSSDSSGRNPAAAAASIADGSATLPYSVILFNSSSSNPNPPKPSFDQPHPVNIQPFAAAPDRAAQIFPDGAGNFSNLMAAATNQSILRFNFIDPPLLRLPDPPQAPPHQKLEEIRAQDIIHQMFPGRGANSAIDWPSSMDPGIYELAGTTDPAAYWSQSHWGDGDPSLYLP